jgi:DNA primase
MPIPQEFLDELNRRTDIVDLVSSYVSLTQKGGKYWGLCPFHSEKTASFSVSPDRQMYYCFGCHKGGGAINFVMELEDLGFVDAVELLAKRNGMEMPETSAGDGSTRKRRERLLELNKEAARWFHTQLKQPQAADGLAYFRKRGLSAHTITSFGLGYAPEGWDNLIRAMAEKGFEKADLLDAGLAVKSKEGRIYDRFRHRVMFPIIDVRGSVIGFGGRVLDDSKPKYLNSPDTLVFNKSRNLFALNLAKKSKQGHIILTEGYMDTIALHQAGFDCAVASLGTSLTEDHAKMLANYTKEVIISYDGDQAGINAAQRAIGLLGKTGINVRVLRVTGAKDPDEFIKAYGADAFSNLLNDASGQIEYRLNQVKAKFDLTQDDQKVGFLQEAAKLVASLQSPVEREIYGNRAADAAELSRESMQQEVKRLRKKEYWKRRKSEERKAMSPMQEAQPPERSLRYQNVPSARAEEGIVRLLLRDDSLFQYTGELTQENFSSPALGKIYGILKENWSKGQSVSTAALSAQLTGEEMSLLARIQEKPEDIASGEKAMADYVKAIQRQRTVSDDQALMQFRNSKRKNGGTTG